MTERLSPNTKAILLLTAPLLAARAERTTKLLTAAEYRKLARRLREIGREPADLLTQEAGVVLEECRCVVEKARLESLLARGFQLSQAVEHWQARSIWVVSRADKAYPSRLKARLRESSPPLLYGCGDADALDTGGLAVVGSRHVDDALIELTEEVGRLTARAGRTSVSGGARGIDQAAMRGALEAGGRVVGVMADSLERAVMKREHRAMLLEGRLVLTSPYDPSAGFNVGHAMQRNKLIYALADAALVVSAEVNKGGTWAGAVEQLEKLRLVPVYVRSTGPASTGLEALEGKGARPWPNPSDPEALKAALAAVPAENPAGSSAQGQLSFSGMAIASEIREARDADPEGPRK